MTEAGSPAVAVQSCSGRIYFAAAWGEHLNYFTYMEQSVTNLEELQLDLLMPVRLKADGR
ncbi:hypothetical protein [Extibacter muris]|uniref:hypothetical protein n=1 Tax=Extibacter muris TaxID=1796622 RepID=UPI0011AE9B44|nr:hypothetical protein [Extibacter muris]